MHLALIAMSGIRALDAQLLGLGLTLPGFVERSKTIASLPSLGLLTLAGMVPPWIEMTYHECPDPSAAPGLPERPDLVAISTFSAQVGEAYALADAYRARGVPVVMGGPHVSVLPEEALLHATTVVIGEGELVWPQVLADAERGTLQRRYGKLGAAFDLAQSPLPRIDLLDFARYNRLTVQTSRGCPHRCEFCASTPLMTAGYRMKPLARILAEIDQIHERWPRPFIEFADDNSFVDRPAWKRLLPELATRHVPWFTETDISIADDLDLVGMLRDAGCRQVLIGLESPVAAGLSGIELRGDWKRRRLDRYASAIRTMQDHGISVNGCFILGLDGQDVTVFDDVLAFVRSSGLAEVQLTVQTAFPGTALYHRLHAAGRLLEPTAWDRCTLFDINFTPTHMRVDELRAGLHRLVTTLYSAEETGVRRRGFGAQRKSAMAESRLLN